MAAVKAFREEMVTAGMGGAFESEKFNDYDARQVRYQILWASYENTVYRNVHGWAQAYRNKYGLYKYIRNIYNPSYRLADFWKVMIWGGTLDPDAGEDGAIPIKVGKSANEATLRMAISKLWELSNWDVNKGICTLRGAALGDTAIKIADDREKGEVRLELVHPETLKDVTTDKRGFVKDYEIVEERWLDNKKVTYRETAERGEGESVIFRTYLNNNPYAWNGIAEEWEENYGFIPLVTIQHNNVGLDWGWSEAHPARSKIHELDDIASKLHDHIRKMVDPIWLFNFKKPTTTPAQSNSAATTDRPEPGREEIPSVYIDNPAAKAQALVASELNIDQVGHEIEKGLQELERDFPELQMDIWSASNDSSGKAMREARRKVETKVTERRPNYDKALVRAQQMAIAIAGMLGYEGFQGYDLASYRAGALDHRIADRSAFKPDKSEILEEKKLFWEVVRAATDAGVTLETALADLDWDDSINAKKLATIKIQQEDRVPTDPETGNPIEQ